MPTEGANPFLKYERIPAATYNGAVVMPTWPKLNTMEEFAKGRKLRGSGCWGPEETSVMRLVLYNRLKQRRPQRMMPSLAEEQEYVEMEVAIAWWCFTIIGLMMPMLAWCKRYRIVHECCPWHPERLDGTRGLGGWMWFYD